MATVSPGTTAATVASVKPRASVSIVLPAASVSMVQPIVAVQVVDQRTSLSFAKPVVAATYAIPVAAIEYIVLDVSAALDPSNRNPFITDSFVVVDSKVIAFAKGLADTFVTTDKAAKNTSKPLSDSVSLTETFTKLLIFQRQFSDSTGVSDASFFELIKASKDVVFGTDAVTGKQYAKFIPDGVAMNDLADVNDGLNIQFEASFTNVVFPQDTKVISLAKALTDAATMTDTPAKEFIPATKQDSFSVSDATALEPNKGLSDSVSESDALTYDFSKVLSDTPNLTDLLAIDVEKLLADSYTPTDHLALEFGKALSDTLSASDALTFNFSVALADLIAATEAHAIDFTKGAFADSASAADAIALGPNKGLSDSVTPEDEGYLRSQSYCDITYFAEDYVGYSRTFT